MPPTYQIGRLGKLYVVEETPYGTGAAPIAADAMRHLDVGFTYNPFNRVNSDEKQPTVGVMTRFDRRKTAGLDLRSAFLRPSGTAGTVPECHKFLRAGFGSHAVVAATSVIYSFTNSLSPISLSLYRYLPNQTWALRGAVVENLKLMFNSNEEAKFSASGPAQKQVRPAPTVPGAFTTVGGNPPSGLTGSFLVNGVAFTGTLMSAQFDIANKFLLQNEAWGTSEAVGAYRDGRRDVTFTLECRVENVDTLYDIAQSGAEFAFTLVCGTTAGNIITIPALRCQFDGVPDTPDGDGANTWSFKGVCLETVGNDELTVELT